MLKNLGQISKNTVSFFSNWKWLRFPVQKRNYIVVAIGDSTVEGIGATKPERAFAPLVCSLIKQDLKRVVFYNFGKEGARIKDVLDSQLDKAISLNPNLILISIGANDVIFQENIFKFEKGYKTLLDRLAKETKALVVVNNIPDMTITPIIPPMIRPFFRFTISLFNFKIKTTTRRFGAIFIDLYKQSKLYKGYQGLIASDGFHPSDIGYALWANTIINQISSLIKY